MPRRSLTLPSTRVAECPLYGVSPTALADLFRIEVTAAALWKRHLRKRREDAEVIARFVNHDLGAFDPSWAGFVVRDDAIWTPDNVPVSQGEVRSVPHVHAQLAEIRRQQRLTADTSLAELRRERAAAEVEVLLFRAIEALRQR